ncbi:hypothetical protein BBD42_14335 [Paenibacillus sp. BIHB 4019]|uniref:Uncharacterized protein n=1 Tax=Paenibacillus sp. BIHB 4019 TaxID=1870819 RepID=A0A1B2DIG5_9BACL|nr:hypothetical protein [Paenibacillus sp. BIHB 4019]ANY67520.1 hypothetical protein BBD42_14335 [Paenibacillus sp. BIHB 4019]
MVGPKEGALFFKPDGSQNIAPLQQKRHAAADFIQKPESLISDSVKEVLTKYASRTISFNRACRSREQHKGSGR